MSKVEFHEGNHVYKVGGKPVISVTKILAHCGIINTRFYKGTEALDRGTAVHDLTARRDQGEALKFSHIPVKFRGFVRAWDAFRSDTGFTPTLVEHRVLCESPLYAGTLDRLGKFSASDAVETLIDLKTHNSGRVATWVKYQLVGYGHALNARRVYQRMGVALHPDGSYAVTRFPPTEWTVDLAYFLHAAQQAIRGGNMMQDLMRRK